MNSGLPVIGNSDSPDSPSRRPRHAPTRALVAGLTAVGLVAFAFIATNQPGSTNASARQYPLHTGIVATTFWVGEIFNPNASDGSQMLSTYDANWYRSYGGCDGITTGGKCATEARTAGNGFYPTSMTPQQNPFYLDLPFDDVNDSTARSLRQSVVPWAGDARYVGAGTSQTVSLMKNRWVRITANGHTCYGQIEDAGPGQYHDASYVFGATDARPANKAFNGAGMDVSPALNGCLQFRELNGEKDLVSWQFVESTDVPAGPWLTIVTSSGVGG
jgi:hypothetical protein